MKFYGQPIKKMFKKIYSRETNTKTEEGTYRQPSGKTSPSSAGGASLLPGRGAKIPHASWPKTRNIKAEAMW